MDRVAALFIAFFAFLFLWLYDSGRWDDIKGILLAGNTRENSLTSLSYSAYHPVIGNPNTTNYQSFCSQNQMICTEAVKPRTQSEYCQNNPTVCDFVNGLQNTQQAANGICRIFPDICPFASTIGTIGDIAGSI